MLTQKVTNSDSQLPTYCDQGTNNLGQVTNISCNTRFAFILQIYVFARIIKIIKSTNNSVWLKIKPTQKGTNIISQLPTYCDKCTNNLGQNTTISMNTRFTYFFKSQFLEKLLPIQNPQTTTFG